MNDPPVQENLSLEALLGQVADEFSQRVNRGEQPAVEDYVERYPQLATILRQLLPTLQVIGTAAVGSLAGEDGPDPEAPLAGRLGDFRIVREVGRGGMGVVYEAEQVSLGRRVALKVLPFAAALDAKHLQRFRNEAQAAAQLHHTHIVPVYAVGCERGVHFYAMQFIDGQTLAAVIHELRQLAGLEQSGEQGTPASGGRPPPGDEPGSKVAVPDATADASPSAAAPPGGGAASSTVHALGAALTASSSIPTGGLTPPARPGSAFFRTVAQLGLQAAEALEHAHQLGVVHRDIKPANLLVELHGHLWVTDFGLARIQSEASLTLTGDLVGTLRYMSPEQARARRGLVDHRTDLYSLGATLYELLTLEPAFAGRDRQELMRQIAGDEPRPPRGVNRALPVDLETIVLKAMAKEPAGRYATAQELADDLRRFLEDKPVKARRPTLAQRAAKWARRHQPVVAAAAAVLVLAVTALAVSTVLIARERAEAVRQRDTARQAVDEMYTEVAEQWLEQEPEMEEVQRQFLLKALRFYQDFAREQGTDPAVRRATALAYRRVGDIQQKLGEQAKAEEAYGQALGLFGRLVKDFPARPEYREGLAGCYHQLGLLHAGAKRHQEAEAAYRQAVALREQLLAEAPASPRYESDLAASLSNLGFLLHYPHGRPREAEQAYRQALALLDRLVGQPPPSAAKEAAPQDQRAVLLSQLAALRAAQGKWAEVRQLLDQAIGHQRLAVKVRPRHPTLRRNLGSQLARLARSLVQLQELPAAEAAYGEASALYEKLAEDFPHIPDYRRQLANNQNDLGDLLHAHGRLQEAQKAYLQTASLREQLAEDVPTAPGHWRDLAWFLATCPDPQFRRSDRAVAVARKAVELAPRGGDCWRTLGVAHYRAGDWPAAVAALTKATALHAGGDAWEGFVLAMAHGQLGDKQQARHWYDQAVRWMETTRPPDENLRRVRAEAAALLGSAQEGPEQ